MAISQISGAKTPLASDISNPHLAAFQFETNGTGVPDGTVPATGYTVTRTGAGQYQCIIDTNGIEMYFVAGTVEVQETDGTLAAKITGWTSTTGTLTFEVADRSAVANAAWSGSVATTSHVLARSVVSWPISIVNGDADPDLPKKMVSTAGTVEAGTVKVVFSATGVPTYTFNTTDAVAAADLVEFVTTSGDDALADTTDQTISVMVLLSTDPLS